MDFKITRQKASENFPYPERGASVGENPPTFIWVPNDGVSEYTVRIYAEDGREILNIKTDKHYAVPSEALPEGRYAWDITADTGIYREKYEFTVTKDAIRFERPTAEEVFSAVPNERPRHLFCARDIEAVKKERAVALRALNKNIEIAKANALPEAPRFYKDPSAKPYREYFGEYRSFVDRDLVALSLGYALLSDAAAGERAKELLLTVCGFGAEGECALHGERGDEIGLSNARCLPAVFDLLYPLLSDDERRTVCDIILAYAKQCYDRLIATDYIKNPANSHVGRIPAYLGEAALVLKGTGVVPDSVLIGYLDFALDIYCGIFPYYGGEDGSWAEGTFYSTSYTKWYIPFFSAVERYTGKSPANRPFYHNYVNYLLHFCDTTYELHPFGDGYWCTPDSPEWPGFFAQNPYRFYAERFGDAAAEKRCAECDEVEYLKLHLLDAFLPKGKKLSSKAHPPEDVRVFPDGGFAAMHSDFSDSERTTVLARASRFGSDSHRHADQGSFAIFSGGACMISPSGYFGRGYGTKHHLEWTNTTAAHNSLLFNGVGQPTFSMKSVGKIIAQDNDKKHIVMDMSEAYDNISLWQREIALEGKSVRITDTVVAPEPVEITYCLHSLSAPKKSASGLLIERSGKRLEILPCQDMRLNDVTDRFGIDLNEGVPDEYAVTMPTQYHITYKTESKCHHLLEVLYKID